MPALRYWDVAQNKYLDLPGIPGATGPTGPTGPTPGPYPFTYTQTLSAPTVASSPYNVRHGLNTLTPLVQMYDALSGLMVMAQIYIVDANNIQITVTANMPNNINVIVIGSAQMPVPVNPADGASKAYVDARTPNLPAPVTSGTTIQSFTDVLGDVWVAKNGINSGAWARARDVLYARWARTAAYTMPTGTAIFPFDTNLRDVFGIYVGASNWMVAPVSGLYDVKAQLSVTATATGQWLEQRLYTGSMAVIIQVMRAHASAAAVFSGIVHATVYMNAGDNLAVANFASAALAASVGIWTTYGGWSFVDFAYRGTG